jgi:hypothetical protein
MPGGFILTLPRLLLDPGVLQKGRNKGREGERGGREKKKERKAGKKDPFEQIF